MSAPGAVRATLREFRQPWLWLGVWVLGWLLAVILSLMHPQRIDLQLPEGDKLEHFLSYATLSAWSVLIFAGRRSQWKAALALVALGIVMELAQGALTSDRMMDPRDALANAFGVGMGQLLALSRAQTLLQRLDRRAFG